MDMIARLKKHHKIGGVSFADLVEVGLVHVFSTNQDMFRDRLLEFQAQYGLHSYDFYRGYRDAILSRGEEGLEGLVPGEDADEWAWLYEQYVGEGGDPFTLPFESAESSCQVRHDGCSEEKWGHNASAFELRLVSAVQR